MSLKVGYVAYLDEAGDDGLRLIRTADRNGSSQWLVLSAFLVKQERDNQVGPWMKSVIQSIDQPQITHMHFRNLREDKRAIVAKKVAELPVRLFAAISHKQNMEGYVNLAAEQAKVNKTAWFYCWMSRLLLERLSAYCGDRCNNDYGEPRSLRIEFSDRGGVDIEDFKKYFAYLSEQSRMGLLYNSYFDLDWSVIDMEQMVSRPNNQRAGLQFADIVASSFFQALEPNRTGAVDPRYAKLLAPRMARNASKQVFGYGLKVMPRWIPSRLPNNQREIFDFYEKG